mgnify:CR=1 FL=1
MTAYKDNNLDDGNLHYFSYDELTKKYSKNTDICISMSDIPLNLDEEMVGITMFAHLEAEDKLYSVMDMDKLLRKAKVSYSMFRLYKIGIGELCLCDSGDIGLIFRK